MTIVYNFKAENVVKYDQEVYNTFMEAFDMLPLAAVVNNSFFCVHGGISDQFMEVNISLYDRFRKLIKLIDSHKYQRKVRFVTLCGLTQLLKIDKNSMMNLNLMIQECVRFSLGRL